MERRQRTQLLGFKQRISTKIPQAAGSFSNTGPEKAFQIHRLHIKFFFMVSNPQKCQEMLQHMDQGQRNQRDFVKLLLSTFSSRNQPLQLPFLQIILVPEALRSVFEESPLGGIRNTRSSSLETPSRKGCLSSAVSPRWSSAVSFPPTWDGL